MLKLSKNRSPVERLYKCYKNNQISAQLKLSVLKRPFPRINTTFYSQSKELFFVVATICQFLSKSTNQIDPTLILTKEIFCQELYQTTDKRRTILVR